MAKKTSARAAASKTTRSKTPKFRRILSLDGGGIRGIIPGQILVTLEARLQQKTGNPSAHIAQYFDMIAGTSTGGILACVLLAPERRGDPGCETPRFSASQAVDLYMERGDEVFDTSVWHRFRSMHGLRDEKYPAAGLEEVLADYLGDLELSELIKPCLVTAYDIKRRQTKFFNQYMARCTEAENFLVRDVARATSAAPTYFEVARIKSKTLVTYALVDGGVFANNPALCAYAEMRKANDCPTAADMVICSLGTGHVNKPFEYQRAKDWGAVEWVGPVIDIIMSGVAETVDYQLRKMYEAVECPDQYIRIEPDLGDASPEMDNASQENITALREAGQFAAEQEVNIRKFDRLIDLLLA